MNGKHKNKLSKQFNEKVNNITFFLLFSFILIELNFSDNQNAKGKSAYIEIKHLEILQKLIRWSPTVSR